MFESFQALASLLDGAPTSRADAIGQNEAAFSELAEPLPFGFKMLSILNLSRTIIRLAGLGNLPTKQIKFIGANRSQDLPEMSVRVFAVSD